MKLGQPQPLSNLSFELNKGSPEKAQQQGETEFMDEEPSAIKLIAIKDESSDSE